MEWMVLSAGPAYRQSGDKEHIAEEYRGPPTGPFVAYPQVLGDLGQESCCVDLSVQQLLAEQMNW